ncbi:MAG TPA: hypothetical protein VGA88_11790 [Burkholderiales bacterium]
MIVIRGIFFLIGFAFAFSVAAHDGPRDSYGCHANIAHGTYHCHSGPLAKRQFRNSEEMMQALKDEERHARPKPKLVPSGYRK